MSYFLRYLSSLSVIFLLGCGDHSTLSEAGAKRLADKNVERCFGGRKDINRKAAFIGSGQFKQGWMFEYKLDDELCAILVGYDGAVELSRTKQ